MRREMKAPDLVGEYLKAGVFRSEAHRRCAHAGQSECLLGGRARILRKDRSSEVARPSPQRAGPFMRRSSQRILTTHAGSLPRPENLTDLFIRRARGESIDADTIA